MGGVRWGRPVGCGCGSLWAVGWELVLWGWLAFGATGGGELLRVVGAGCWGVPVRRD